MDKENGQHNHQQWIQDLSIQAYIEDQYIAFNSTVDGGIILPIKNYWFTMLAERIAKKLQIDPKSAEAILNKALPKMKMDPISSTEKFVFNAVKNTPQNYSYRRIGEDTTSYMSGTFDAVFIKLLEQDIGHNDHISVASLIKKATSSYVQSQNGLNPIDILGQVPIKDRINVFGSIARDLGYTTMYHMLYVLFFVPECLFGYHMSLMQGVHSSVKNHTDSIP